MTVSFLTSVSHTQLASEQLNGYADQFAFSRILELHIDIILFVSHLCAFSFFTYSIALLGWKQMEIAY